MLSSVLKSKRAVQMNILIIRAFIRLREILATHKELARKLEDLEREQQEQGAPIAAVYNLVKKLMAFQGPSAPDRLHCHRPGKATALEVANRAFNPPDASLRKTPRTASPHHYRIRENPRSAATPTAHISGKRARRCVGDARSQGFE